MNEEEKKAIEYFKNLDVSFNTLLRIDLNGFRNAIDTILKLIEKQQKEIEKLNKKIQRIYDTQTAIDISEISKGHISFN